ncbi:MAG: hypothetical protein HZB59_09900 [Ignavibacteriales bacterium]|nr:hypothetical protein [Ignavibacteriales bacterium]
MSHQQLNQIFSQYISTLYNAAKRMIDKRHPQYDDKVQDLVILAYEEFIRKVNEGKIMELALLIHYMKLRKKEVQIEMRGYSRTNKTDVFNKRNYYEGKLELHSIDNSIFNGEGDTYADIIQDESNLEDYLHYKIDLDTRLSKLSEKERIIFMMKEEGYNDDEIAQAVSVNIQTVKSFIDRLLLEFSNKHSNQFTLQL